ncbi:hypothetical protein [Eoetvoesiella caeni]
MLETYFRNCLEDFGFPVGDFELFWSVGFCQGDYVAFKGKIKASCIETLMVKMHGLNIGPATEDFPVGTSDELKSMISVLSNFGQCDLEITCSRNQSMRLETSDSFVDIFDYDYQNIILNYSDTIPFEKSNVWEAHWQAFQKWLSKQATSLASKMLKDAHSIRLATVLTPEVVRTVETDNYVVRIIEVPDEEFSLEYWDPGLIRDTYANFIAGAQRYFGLSAVVLDKRSGRELGSATSGGYISSVNNQEFGYDGLRAEVLHAAICEVRDLFSRHKVAA